MSTYLANGNPNGTLGGSFSTLTLSEQNIYGSSRLGVLNRNISVIGSFTPPSILNFTRGNKFFELSNHLGNVLAVITDIKYGHTTDGTTYDYYFSNTINAQDYYPFGMVMPGRKYLAPRKARYRYGFNDKENDNDVKGDGNQQDYGMRIYDPRVGKFLSLDPLSAKYPFYSPYQFSGNTPIQAVDVDGLEEHFYYLELDKQGKTIINLSSWTNIAEEHSFLWGAITWLTKIPERYNVRFNGQTYKIGYSASQGGAGNEGKEKLFSFLIKSKTFDARIIPTLFYSEDEATRNALTHTLDNVKEAAFNALFGDFTSVRSINFKGFSKGKLEQHFTKHGTEFPNETQAGYLKQAKEFAKESGEHIQEEVVGNFYIKYDKTTRRTLIGNIKDREIRTFYKADERSANPFDDAVKIATDLSKPK